MKSKKNHYISWIEEGYIVTARFFAFTSNIIYKNVKVGHLLDKRYIELLKITLNFNVKSHLHLNYIPIAYKIAQNEKLQEFSLHLENPMS